MCVTGGLPVWVFGGISGHFGEFSVEFTSFRVRCRGSKEVKGGFRRHFKSFERLSAGFKSVIGAFSSVSEGRRCVSWFLFQVFENILLRSKASSVGFGGVTEVFSRVSDGLRCVIVVRGRSRGYSKAFQEVSEDFWSDLGCVTGVFCSFGGDQVRY